MIAVRTRKTKGTGEDMQPTNTPPNTPPNMQPRPGITIRGRRFTLPWVIGGVVAVLVILSCGCCGTVSLASALNGGKGAQATATSGQSGQAQVTHAPATPKATAKATAQATATRAPSSAQTVNDPVLGGTEIAFIQSGASETYIFKDRRTFQGSVNGVAVVVGGTLIDGTGGQRFWWLTVTPLDKGVTWDSATALDIAKQLIPTDARYLKDVNVPDFGLEHIYRSKTLAASFPASAFTDANTGAAVTPGTLYISCGNATSQQGGCTIQTGQ